MKKVFAMIAVFPLLVSLAACGGNYEPEAYVASNALVVETAYVDGQAKVITRKTTDKELSGVKLACVYFDAAGQQVGEFEVIEGDVVKKDVVSSWTFDAPAGCVYVEAIVAGVTYADGTAENCPGVDTWAKDTAATFNAQAQKTALTAAAAEAENCPAVTYTVEEMKDTSVDVELTNTGDQAITEAVVYSLWFDAQGDPVDIGGNFAKNAKRSSLKDLAAGENASYTVPAPEGTAKAKMVIETVTFADGTIWENAAVYKWLAANRNTAE